MEMKAIERFIDARHNTEGKVVAVALTAMLALSTFTPTALAVADEMDSATVSDKAAAATDAAIEAVSEENAANRVTVNVEADNATVLLNDKAVQDVVEIDADADAVFAVRVDEGFSIDVVMYNDTALEMAGTQRSVSTEPVAAEADEETQADYLFVIPANTLADNGLLKVATVAASVEDVEASDETAAEDENGDEADAGQQNTTSPSDSPATVGTAVTGAIAEGVTKVAAGAVEQVHTPLLTMIEGNAVVVGATLWHGTLKLGDRTVSVPAAGEVDIAGVSPVAESVFNFGSNSYVLNGKVGVVGVGAPSTLVKDASDASNAGNGVTALRVADGKVQYKTAGSDWATLGDDEQLVYFCSKLQGAADTKGMLNVAVEENVLDTLVAGGHGVQVFAFASNAEAGADPLFTQTLYFDGGVTSLPQGVQFNLGDGVSYQVERAYISNDSEHGAEAYTAEEALAFRNDGAVEYDGETISWAQGTTYRAIAVFVNARAYAASFDLNGGAATDVEDTELATVTEKVGASVVLPTEESVQMEGHYLAAWKCLDAAGNQLGVYEPGATLDMPARDVVLQAQWESYEGEKFFVARFVWTDEDGKETEIERRTVTEIDDEGITVATQVSTDVVPCPTGYTYAAAGNAAQTVNAIGRVITFYCDRNQYKVETQLLCGQAQLQLNYADVYYGTKYTYVPVRTVTVDGVTYVYDEQDPNNQLSVTVSEDVTKNAIKVYYARDVMGVVDPDAGDGIPDKYQVKVTFQHDENSVWADGSDQAEKSVVVNRYNDEGELAADGVGHLAADQIPALEQTDGLVMDAACNWPKTETEITVPITFVATFVVGNFPYTVRYVGDDGKVLDEVTDMAGFGTAIPYEADKAFEGYALDSIENKNGVITSEGANNVVTVRYGVDRMGVADMGDGDGVPDKYQATAVYKVQHGAWVDASGVIDSKTVVVTMYAWDGDAWVPLADNELQLQLPGASAHQGYEPNQGAWDVKPSAETLIAGAITEFTYSFVPQQIGYTVIYYKDSLDGEVLGADRSWAAFDGPVPVQLEKYRPVQGFTGEPTYVGATVMGLSEDQNVLHVVYNRDAYTVRGVFAEGSHGTIRGNATQTVLFNRDSETMTFTADEGYRIASVVVNGESQPVANGQTTYDFKIRRVSKDANVVVRTAHMDEVVIEAPSRSKVYDGTALGGGEPQITGVPEGFTATARVSGSRTNAGVTATTIDPASIKVLDASGTDVTQNFQVTTIDGSLTVEQARAIVTVNNASKPAGTSDPVFTGQVAGLVEGDVLKGLSYLRTVTGEMAGVYLDALTAEFEYNPNYNVTVVPGTFTIGDTTLTQIVGQTSTPSGMNPGPRGGSIETVYRTASSVDALAQALAAFDDYTEPVYADIVFDDSVPMVTRTGETIEDDATALGAFDEPKCWVHWVMAMGLLITIAYAVAVVRRRLGYGRAVRDLDDNLTGAQVVEAETASSAAYHVGA